jgi:cytoskeletal protein CcmA (bactofilin family)
MFNKDKAQDKPAAPSYSEPEPFKSPASVSSSPAPASVARSSSTSGGPTATIGPTIRVKGDISGDENLKIEGTVEGTVSLAAHELEIGQSGKVTANLTAKTIRIHGEVQGDVVGKEYVIITASSRVRGNIVTPRMTLEDGARFKGSIDIDPEAGKSGTASFSSGKSDFTTGSKTQDLAGGKTG